MYYRCKLMVLFRRVLNGFNSQNDNPDYQNTNIKNFFIKIVPTDCFTSKSHQRTQLK